MTARDVAEWEAFESLEGPPGEQRGDLRSAIIISEIINFFRDKKSPAVKAVNFMPFVEDAQKVEQQTPEQMLNFFKAFATQQNAAIEVRKEKL